MHVITGGTYNGVNYSCMYCADEIIADEKKQENNIELYGFYGIADSHNDAPSLLWFDENMNFIKGEIAK